MSRSRSKKVRQASDRLIEREMIIQSIGVALEEVIASQGIDKAELARRLNKSSADICQLLSGDRNLTLASISNLAYALGYRARVAFEPLPNSQNSFKPMDVEMKSFDAAEWRVPSTRMRKTG